MKGVVGSIVTGVVIVLVIICGFACTERIPAGYVGVVYNMNGGVEDEVLTQGWKIVSPTKNVTLYSIALEQSYMTKSDQGDSPEDESFEIPTKEGAALEVDIAFSYSYELSEVPQTFTRFRGQNGKEILKSFIKPKMQAWIKEITPTFSMISIVSTQRGEVNKTLTEQLQNRFRPYGVVIDNIALADVRPDPETDEAIRKKIKAQEDLETAKVTAEKDKVEATRDKEIAEINAEKAKIEAQGQADAELIRANAEAEANKKIAESLTDKLIEKAKYDKWNGELPYIEGASTPIVNIKGTEKTE